MINKKDNKKDDESSLKLVFIYTLFLLIGFMILSFVLLDDIRDREKCYLTTGNYNIVAEVNLVENRMICDEQLFAKKIISETYIKKNKWNDCIRSQNNFEWVEQ